MKHQLKLQLLAFMLFTALSIMAQPPDPEGEPGRGIYVAEIDSLAQLLPKEISFYSYESNIFLDLNGSAIVEADMIIMNIKGQIVNRKKITSNSRTVIKSELPNGFYFVRLFTNNKFLNKKFYITN